MQHPLLCTPSQAAAVHRLQASGGGGVSLRRRVEKATVAAPDERRWTHPRDRPAQITRFTYICNMLHYRSILGDQKQNMNLFHMFHLVSTVIPVNLHWGMGSDSSWLNPWILQEERFFLSLLGLLISLRSQMCWEPHRVYKRSLQLVLLTVKINSSHSCNTFLSLSSELQSSRAAGWPPGGVAVCRAAAGKGAKAPAGV